MKFSFILVMLFALLPLFLSAQISVCSWNLRDFGGTKSNEEILFIAEIVKNYDVIAVQEVVAKDPAGAQAVATLNDILNRKGFKWDYVVSDPTSGENSYKRERYAFIWKTAKLSIVGRPWLEQKYTIEIDREPYYCTFRSENKEFTLVNFHAITKSRQPEREVKYFKNLPEEYPTLNLLFCGDFNLPESHTLFNPLKSKGYIPILTGQKTSLKELCSAADCLSSEFDNIFFHPDKVNFKQSGVIHFYNSFSTLKEARMISDHIPVYFEFSLN